MELGHFDKLFVKSKRRKATQGKMLKLFPPGTLQTTFWMEDLTQVETQLGPFFQNQGIFFYFRKRAGKASHLVVHQCLSLKSLTSIIRTGKPILVELIDLVNSFTIFYKFFLQISNDLTQWLTVLLKSHTVTLTVLLFWISFFLLTLVFVLQWLSLHWVILIMLSQFPLTFHQIYNRMPFFIT